MGFDLPFKIMIGKYSPNLDYDYPIFVIPGSIDRERRDYISVLNLFFSKDILEQEDSGFLQELTKKAISYSNGFRKECFQKQILKTLLSKQGILYKKSCSV